ncbi:heavy metal translocating P-type ATPase [Halobacterium jilantaiense]|uniref:Cu2+-exporting ATPase n=1 Tax=Halobacterium jilantaiense TaxID=355548 RepID=A0A1I0PSD2_9EURY|nr:cation-translocating P-type ATPase [Halobacterium jilantaiense]SEW17323.1 Cu2+-exporting ATPase [Halobacterium jilantaiense]
MSECALCDLPTPDPPVTEDGVDGEYCCRGCLEVGRRLDDVTAADPENLNAAAVDDSTPDDSDVPESAETAYLDVDGLHCSACELFLQAEATDTAGVHDADVSYATDAARVTYDPEVVDPSDLPGVFDRLGYGASLPDGDESGMGDAGGWLAGDDRRVVVGSLLGMVVMLGYGLVLYGSYLDLAPTAELGVLAATLALGTVYCAVTFGLVFGLLEAVALLAVLQSVSFAAILNADSLSVGTAVPAVAALASVVVFHTGRPFLRGAYVSLRAGRPNMDLLVALAVLAAWGYSVAAYAAGSAHVYFDVAVMVVLVVTLGNRIEERVKSRAVSGLSAFAAASVDDASRRTSEGGTETVPVDDLGSGDEVVVRAGERVPVDGTVAEGAAAVDESLVTGESVPDRKRPGDEVLGGTVVTDDALVVAVGEGPDSTADQLVELLWDVRSARPGVQQVADRLAAVFVPLVVALAVVTAGYYLWSGAGVADAVLTGVAVLVVSCPCALGLATPLAVSAGVREALDAGVVVTDAGVFERVRNVDVVVLDKTGTLTTGEMAVEAVTAVGGIDPESVLTRAAAVEQFSTHPVAEAVTDRADPPAVEVTDFDRKPRGVTGTVDGDRVLVGHPGLFDDGEWSVPDRVREATDCVDGVPTVVSWNGEARGVLAVADQPREEWLSVVEDLAAAGREVVVLTGDDPDAADPFREHDAVSDVFAGVPPEGKARAVRAVGENATVAMVGDGSNDAPALAAADLGVAMGSGTELAADAADAVVTADLDAVPEMFGLADATRSRIRQNLAWAFTYNAVAIPLAVAALLNPLFAAAAMAGSSLVVVGNSARPLRGGLLSGLLAG